MSNKLNGSDIFDEHKHLSQYALQSLKDGTLSEFELLLASDHIAECGDCASAYADSFSTDELAEVPSSFSDEIQTKLERKRANNRQFYFYTMRVAIAASIALVITFSGAINYVACINSKAANMKPLSFSFVNTINTSLQDFSQKILNMEVYQNEKEKR